MGEIEINIDARNFDAMDPKALQATKVKLPHNWMIWEDFVISSYHLQNNVIETKRPFANG